MSPTSCSPSPACSASADESRWNRREVRLRQACRYCSRGRVSPRCITATAASNSTNEAARNATVPGSLIQRLNASGSHGRPPNSAYVIHRVAVASRQIAIYEKRRHGEASTQHDDPDPDGEQAPVALHRSICISRSLTASRREQRKRQIGHSGSVAAAAASASSGRARRVGHPLRAQRLRGSRVTRRRPRGRLLAV